jgi:hypothetical protein
MIKGTLAEFRERDALPKGSRIIIKDGKFENMLGYFRKWNGTTCYVDIDRIGRKALSKKRSVGIIRRG